MNISNHDLATITNPSPSPRDSVRRGGGARRGKCCGASFDKDLALGEECNAFVGRHSGFGNMVVVAIVGAGGGGGGRE